MLGVGQMDYYVFWVDGGVLGDRIVGGDAAVSFRKVTSAAHLKNVLYKNIGGPKEIKEAIEKDSLRVVLGTAIMPTIT